MTATATDVSGTTSEFSAAADFTGDRRRSDVHGDRGCPFCGQVAGFTSLDPVAAVASDFTATINWGDGTSPQRGRWSRSPGDFVVIGSHSFTTANPASRSPSQSPTCTTGFH